MAKFKELNLELQDNEEIKLGGNQVDSHIYYDGSDLLIKNFTGNVTISGSSGLITTKPSRCSAYLSAVQAVVTYGTWHQVEFDLTAFDELNEFNTTTHKFTAKNSGYYIVTGAYGFEGLADDDQFGMYINKDGTPQIYNVSKTGGVISPRKSISKVMYIAKDSFVDMYVRHLFGADRDLHAAISGTGLTVHRLS